MKIVAISDTHGELPSNLPEGDVLCICGDIFPLKMQRNIPESHSWLKKKFVKWCKNLPFKHIILVAGNHDFYFDERWWPDEWPKAPKTVDEPFKGTNIVYLQDSSVEIDGKVFYGSPWIADLKNWAFYLRDEELVEMWGKIPPKTDVIMTHMPPKYGEIGRVLQEGQFNSGADYGSESLAVALLGREFQYAISGHVHSGQHSPVRMGHKHLANVSIKNEDYDIHYIPLEFEI